ncbi:hypothetical protein GT755_21115 [Herbidospora sp. NEAU-GS84]|uniref:Uncharacterized protein n=1 Tax=Herbidospora solisilvae TaxID=2696284 RepID=A0A7C9J446_9ACTN|nr:hypothetical protein [Herbidospora solisilvae]NAS24182.1 hypothetical protein [Herbidospora solisilvae]
MRKGLRLLIAGASGVALFASGVAIAASPASAVTVTVTNGVVNDTFIPPVSQDTMSFSFDLAGAYHEKFGDSWSPKYKIWARVTPDYNPGAGVTVNWRTANVTQLAKVTTQPGATSRVTGSFTVQNNDKPGDRWRLQISAEPIAAPTQASPSPSPTATAAPDTWQEVKTFTVTPATRVSNVGIDPNPVVLKGATDVGFSATIEKFGGETLKQVRALHPSSGEYYSLGTSLEGDDKSYYNFVTMGTDAPAGDWQIKFTITRGTKTYAFTKGFKVSKTSAPASKAKSKITMSISPTKVKKGKYIKVYGKVYRGVKSWGPWKKKILKLYFKKKGTKSWKFVSYVGANNSGKYSKTVKPKYDGWYRMAATSTSATKSSYSPYKLVDVR